LQQKLIIYSEENGAARRVVAQIYYFGRYASLFFIPKTSLCQKKQEKETIYHHKSLCEVELRRRT
jgi:hypothetical protein